MGLVSDVIKISSNRNYRLLFNVGDVGVYVAEGEVHKTWLRREPNVMAYAVGKCVIFRDMRSLTPANLRHELEHVRQTRAVGGQLVYYPLYCLSAAWAFVTRGNAYDNYFERLANEAEKR